MPGVVLSWKNKGSRACIGVREAAEVYREVYRHWMWGPLSVVFLLI